MENKEVTLIYGDKRSHPQGNGMYAKTRRMRGRGRAARLGGAFQAKGTAARTEAFGLDNTQHVWGPAWPHPGAQEEECRKLRSKR